MSKIESTTRPVAAQQISAEQRQPSKADTKKATRTVILSGVDRSTLLAKANQAKNLLAKGNVQAGAAKGGTTGSRFVAAGTQTQFGKEPAFPRLSQADLPTIAKGTAAAWTSVSSLGMAARQSLSFMVPAGQQLSLTKTDGESARLAGPLEVPATTMVRWQKTAPESFRRAFANLTGKEAKLDAKSGRLDLNPQLVEPRAEWVAPMSQSQELQRDAQSLLERFIDEEGREKQGRDQQQGEHESDSDSDDNDSSDLLQQLVALAEEPSMFLGELPREYRAAVEGAQLPDLEAVGSALSTAASAFTGYIIQSTGTNNYSGQSLLDLLDDPSVPIEDKIFYFMMAVSADYEDKLVDKMEEIELQEQAQDTREEIQEVADAVSAFGVDVIADTSAISSDGTSSTVQMAELEYLMHQWKQMTDMTSNLLKNLHDMAMTPIRNMR